MCMYRQQVSQHEASSSCIIQRFTRPITASSSPLTIPSLLKKQTLRPAIRPYYTPLSLRCCMLSPARTHSYHAHHLHLSSQGPVHDPCGLGLRLAFRTCPCLQPQDISRLVSASTYRTACDAGHRAAIRQRRTSFSKERGIFDADVSSRAGPCARPPQPRWQQVRPRAKQEQVSTLPAHPAPAARL